MTDEERMKAMRLARAIASDISLYNEQKIIKGIEQDNLFDALKDEIAEGRELYDDQYYQAFFAAVRPELEQQLEEASGAVASLITRAWEQAGRPALPHQTAPRPPARIRK